MSKGVPAWDGNIIIGLMVRYDDHCFIIGGVAPLLTTEDFLHYPLPKQITRILRYFGYEVKNG